MSSDGSLDRAALGAVMFGDPDRPAKLKAITLRRRAQIRQQTDR